jgi:hypothetical protein
MTEHLDVFVVGKDGRMYTSWWHKGQDWSGRNDNWLAIGGFFPPGAPTSAVGRLQNHLDVFVVGNDDQMYTSWWHEGQDWSGRNDNWHSLLHRDKVPFELERAKILEKYNQLGGRISSLGLPADAQMPVFNTGTSFRMNFRGGHIDLPAGSDKPVAVKRFRAEIWWMGIECQIRQEGTDEIYGGIGVLVPGSGLSKTEKFSDDTDGTWDMGPDGMRIINTARLLYNGPPMDIVLTVSLIEHDSGDQSEVKNKIADAIAKAAQSMAVLAGIPAEATSATQGWVNDLSLGLVSAVGNALGVNDDRYPPQQLRIRWPEIQGRQFVRKTARRNDDPRTIEYTHVITVTGFDEARDRGQYALYFDVRLFEDQEVLP